MQDSSYTETTSSDVTSDEEVVSARKRKRNFKKTTNYYNVKVEGASSCAVGSRAKFNVENKQEERRTFDASRVLEDFESFLKDVVAFRGPEKDRIESFILQDLLPYIEDHAIKCRSTCGDLLEVLAKLGSPTLKSPRIAKRALKLLVKFIHMDIGDGVTNAHIVATEKCLRRPIVDGSFKEELTHDQRRRIDVYCNVLMAMLIGRVHGHLPYTYNTGDNEEIEECITQIEEILRLWPLPRKYRRRLSLEIILGLLQRMMDKKRMLKRLKGLLDVCENMLNGFNERDVDSLLCDIDRVDGGAWDLYVIIKMLHAKINNQPKAFEILKAILTRHDLFSASWHHKKERDHWHFALLACQILVDVITNHRCKATSEDAARTLDSFCKTKAYEKSVVINAIIERYSLKAAFAPDFQSRKILLENRFGLDEKLPLELLRKRLCSYNQSGCLEIYSTICEGDGHVIMRGMYSHKPVVVKSIPVCPVSSLFNAQDQETSPAKKRFENAIKITQYLNSKSTEHVTVCYTADTTSLPHHHISEHMTNGDLPSYLRNLRIPPSYREVLQICLTSARNMEFLHKHKVVHTQLRAENLLVGDRLENIKISGLSLARHTSDREFHDGFKGETLSPDDEAVRWADRGGLADPPIYSSKSDVWAYGCLMYEIISCGNVPYLNEDLIKVRLNILAGRIWIEESMKKKNYPSMKDSYYCLMQRCFRDEEVSFTEICNELRDLISGCDETDDHPMIFPQNVPHDDEQATEHLYDEIGLYEECEKTEITDEEEDMYGIHDDCDNNKREFQTYNNSEELLSIASIASPKIFKKLRCKTAMATLADASKTHVDKLKSLRHDHVVKVFSVKKIKNGRRISYEHYAGLSLRDYIKDNQCTEEDLIRFAAQISSALNHLHSLNIVHCSVTIDNIVVVNCRHVKLSGLQYTRSLKPHYIENCGSTSTIDGGPIAEYLYRWNAKEVIQEGLFSKGSDIWSLGILMWEMFQCLDSAGHDEVLPFPQYRDSEILTQLKCGARPVQPSRCPDWVYIVMTQCWLLHTIERASSLLVWDCLTHRVPWESYLLHNWLSKHKVYENNPNLDIIQMKVQQCISPPQEDVIRSMSEEFAAEHCYAYAQIPDLKSRFKTVHHMHCAFGKASLSERPLPALPGSTTSSQPLYQNIQVIQNDQMDKTYENVAPRSKHQVQYVNQETASARAVCDPDRSLHRKEHSNLDKNQLYATYNEEVDTNQAEENSTIVEEYEMLPSAESTYDVSPVEGSESQRASNEKSQEKNEDIYDDINHGLPRTPENSEDVQLQDPPRFPEEEIEDLYAGHINNDLPRNPEVNESSKEPIYLSASQTPRLLEQNSLEKQYRVLVGNHDDIVVQYYV